MTVELYCFGESGHSYKVALGLELSGTAWRARKVDFFGGETRSDAYRRDVNVMGEAPVMIHDGDTYTQSGVMLHKISELSGKFGGKTPHEAQEILRWMLWDNSKLTTMMGMLRFLMNFVPEDKRPKEVIGFYRSRLKSSYAILNTHLTGRDWVVGEGPTIADFSLCGYCFYPEAFGFDRNDWPGIDHWLDQISNLQGWKAPYELMPGNPSERAS